MTSLGRSCSTWWSLIPDKQRCPTARVPMTLIVYHYLWGAALALPDTPSLLLQTLCEVLLDFNCVTTAGDGVVPFKEVGQEPRSELPDIPVGLVAFLVLVEALVGGANRTPHIGAWPPGTESGVASPETASRQNLWRKLNHVDIEGRSHGKSNAV
jgi:hypothetical protein